MYERDIAKLVLEQCLSSYIPGVKRTRKNIVFSSFRPLQQILPKTKRMAQLPPFQHFLTILFYPVLPVQPAPIRKDTYGAAHSAHRRIRLLPLLRSYFAHIRALTLCRYASTKMYKHILWWLSLHRLNCFIYDTVPPS